MRPSLAAFGRVLAAASSAVLVTLALPQPASAGRLLVTGHGADLHCAATADTSRDHCHFIRAATEHVRAAAPDPSRPVLVLACMDRLATPLSVAYKGAPPGSEEVCPSSATFALTSLDTSRYSAIVVTTSVHLTQAGSTALNGRTRDIEAFFNAGGGVFANTGVGMASYYDFLPLAPGLGVNQAPYALTPAGAALGLEDSANAIGTHDDINCCPTHTTFEEPAVGGPVTVAERDANGIPITLVAEGAIAGSAIVAATPARPGRWYV